jgi:formylglycine-generating enzyme required for sulfatase activity
MGIPVRSIESERFDEIPGRTVTLDAFRIDLHEVSNRQYALFLAWEKKHASKAHKYCSPLEPASKAKAGHVPKYWGDKRFMGDAYPVVGVDWYDAYAFAHWAGKRLPTEAEWERAARSADGRVFPWGDTFAAECALTGKRVADLWAKPLTEADVPAFKRWLLTVDRLTARVDAYPKGRSADGLYDMSGNVSEWTQDWYQRTYYQTAPSADPKGPASGKERTARGGSWLDFNPLSLTCTAREPLAPGTRRTWLGFRCAQDADAPAARRLR